MNEHYIAIWAISLLAIALVLIRPRGWPEAWWASAGAVLLVISSLLPAAAAAKAVREGLDVYLFLTGMMIISELARREGVFDWLAGHAVNAAGKSRTRLFALVYAVGVVVTAFLSNDATAVVLTPAVFAAIRRAKAEPLPYLMICAFIANAASFVLPISNPANLVVYSSGMPPLFTWLRTFALPSLASIVVTYILLCWLSRKHLQGAVEVEGERPQLSLTGKITLAGIGLLAATLLTASALKLDLGAPALVVGIIVALAVTTREHSVVRHIAGEISWSVLPLVAGLFVIVEALNSAGALSTAANVLRNLAKMPALSGGLSAGFGIAVLSNLMNNLPSGLIGGAAVRSAGTQGTLRDAVLLGVDLGPNLSITGSLATILWLIAIRREGQQVGFWTFLRWGALVMPPALLLAILCLR